MDQYVGRQIGNYKIIELIGKGGMAAVYKGYQPSMNRNVAIKIMAQQYTGEEAFVQRFENEARLIAQLEHAHILPVYDFGQQEGMLYIVMRYLPTGTLEDRITRDGMPIREAVHIFNQIASALDYAHSRGVIHRDLKPANILIDAQNNAFLSDFGIAKSLEEQSNLTGTGGVVGTPTYMSPEQGLGEKIDARSDIYALGVMLFEMLTGQVPFTADNPMAVMLKHINELPPHPSEIKPSIPTEVSAVVLRSLSKNPADRYQTAKEMADALEQAILAASGQRTRAGRLPVATVPGQAGASPQAATLPAPIPGRPQPATAVPGQAGVAIPSADAAIAVPGRPGEVSALMAMGEITIELNKVSAWLDAHEVVGTWMQAIGLSLVTWLILVRLTSGATLETALLALIPGVVLYGLLRAPTVGALVSFILILAPLLAHTPGLALIWLLVTIIAGARLNSREIMLTLVTMLVAGHPLGWIIPLLAPWWLRVRRTVLPVALGVTLAMLFAFTLRWPTAGGLLPVPGISDEAYYNMQFSPFDTTFLGLFENTGLWSPWTDPQRLWEAIQATFVMIGSALAYTSASPLMVAAAWATASTLSVSNQRVDSPYLRALGLAMGFALLMVAHLLFRPAGLGGVSTQALVLVVISAVLAFLFSQWPIQANPIKGNKIGTTLRMLRQTLGVLFMALGVSFFTEYLTRDAVSPLYPVFWMGGVFGTLVMITNAQVGPPIVFASLVAALAPIKPVQSAVMGGLLFIYLVVSSLFDRRRPRHWNPLGAGLIIGAPGMAAAGILPLGPLALGALEAQVPAALLAVASHVLLITVSTGINPLAVIVQVITTLAGVLVVERLMGLSLLGSLNHKLRRLIFTVGAGLLMAVSYYTLGQAAPISILIRALALSMVSAAVLVAAMGDRALFWRQFIEREEEEHEVLEDEEVTGPWTARPKKSV